MFKIIRILRCSGTLSYSKRTFLSQAYHCNEIWKDRLNNPIFQKVNLDILYQELDNRFHKTHRISPVDVDIFASAVKTDNFIDEMLDLLHKLRITEDTGNALESTGYAAIRALNDNNRTAELLQVIDDRLNYGVFLDYHIANILMDKFWKEKNFVAGSIIASQFMLQEDFGHPLTRNLALLHCYNYLVSPGEWPQMPVPEEPEEVVKIRVAYLRNPYNDEHFDLREPLKIVGKTLTAAAVDNNPVNNSLKTLGLILFGKIDLARNLENREFVKEVVDLIPEDLREEFLKDKKLLNENVHDFLIKQVTDSVSLTSESDIANHCVLLNQWDKEREDAIEVQKQRLLKARRLQEVERVQQELKQKEAKLWFFENEEHVELEIEELDFPEKEQKPIKKIKRKAGDDTDYIPPEIIPKRV